VSRTHIAAAGNGSESDHASSAQGSDGGAERGGSVGRAAIKEYLGRASDFAADRASATRPLEGPLLASC